MGCLRSISPHITAAMTVSLKEMSYAQLCGQRSSFKKGAIMTKEAYLKRFKEITEEMYKLTSLKNQDYSPGDEALDNFKEYGTAGVLVRLSDKAKRLKNKIWHKHDYVVNETVMDTAIDQAVYSVILVIMLEEEAKKEKPSIIVKVRK
jgi:hypothetical protein